MERRDGRFLLPRRGEYDRGARKDRQEPVKNIGDARRDVRRVRRRHAAPVRDAPPGRWTSPGRGRPRPWCASMRLLQRIWRVVVDEQTGPPRASDAVPTEDAPGAEPGDRRRPRRYGDAPVQHRHREDHRADQPPDPGLRPGRALTASGGRALVLLVARWPRTSPRSCGRGWGTDSLAWRVPGADPALPGRRHRRGRRAGQRKSTGDVWWPPTRTPRRWRLRRARTTGGSLRCWTGRTVRKRRRRPRPAGQRRRHLTKGADPQAAGEIRIIARRSWRRRRPTRRPAP